MNSPPRIKKHWRELAVAGGTPAFEEPLHVGRPNIGERGRLISRVHDALDRKWLSNNGPYVQELERELAALCGVEHCVVVANGTLALELAAAAVLPDQQDVGFERNEVLMPSLTFIATAHAFYWRGFKPVFVDIDPDSLTADADSVAARISDRTCCVCGVHLFGQVSDVDRLQMLAAANDVPLLFDASHALGNQLVDASGVRRVGQFGDVETFSLHATKFIGCGEGGAVVTNSEETAERVRKLRNFGYGDDGVVHSVGINAKMSELAAAMGLSMIEQMDDFVACNRANYEAYADAFRAIPGVSLQPVDKANSNCQYVVIRIDEAQLDRDAVLRTLRAEQVLARPYFSPACHESRPYADWQHHPLPHTDAVSTQLIVLPTGEAVSERDIQAIARILDLAAIQAARAA